MLSAFQSLWRLSKSSSSRRRAACPWPAACEILEVRRVLTDPTEAIVPALPDTTTTPPPPDVIVPPVTNPPVILTPQQTQTITTTIQTAVDASGLPDLTLYVADVEPSTGIPFWPFDNTPAVAGFDCDDYALVMANFLTYTLPSDYTISYVTVVFGNSGHAMVTVQANGTFVIVDPQTGSVTTPVTTLAATTPLITQILTTNYNFNGTGTVTVTPSTTVPGASVPSFTTSPAIVAQFIAALQAIPGTDPLLYMMPAP